MHGRHQTSCVSTTGGTRPSGRVARSSVGPNIAVTGDAERGRQVHRARIVRDEPAAVGEHAGERRQIGPADEVDTASTRPPRSDFAPAAAVAPGCRSAPRPRRPAPARPRARRTTRPASAWRRRTPRPGARATSGARPSQPAPLSSSRPAARSAAGDVERAARADRSGIRARAPGADSRPPDALVRGARPPRQQRRAAVGPIAPALGNAGAPDGERRLKRVRQQQRRVERPRRRDRPRSRA